VNGGYRVYGEDFYEACALGTMRDLSLGGVLVTARRVPGGWEIVPSSKPIPSHVMARGRSRERTDPARVAAMRRVVGAPQ
jgi:hypothetical protein